MMIIWNTVDNLNRGMLVGETKLKLIVLYMGIGYRHELIVDTNKNKFK